MILDQQPVDLGTIFVAHQAQLRRAALKILGDLARAEDVVQDAYLKVTESERAPNIKQPWHIYIRSCVTSLSIGIAALHSKEGSLRTRKKGCRCQGRWQRLRATAISRQNLTVVARALSELPERTRRVFELHRLDGHTHCAIATQLNISTSLVNILIHDAMNHCRAALRSM